MKINIFTFFLVAIYFISASFWGLVALPFPIKDGILIFAFTTLLFYMSYFNKNSLYEDRSFYYFFLYAFFMSIVMASLNFAQPVLYSMRAARLFIVYIFLMMALNILLKNFQIKKVYPFMFLISFLIIFINVYVYATGDTSFLVDGVGVLKRLGEIRVTIGTFTSIIFVFFFYHQIKTNKLFIIPLLGLLFTMIIVAKTRSVIFPVLIIMLIPLLRAHKAQVIKVWMAFGTIVLVSFIVSGYENSILSPIVKLVTLLIEESQSIKHSNVNIRGVELAYFVNFLDMKSTIFGFGMDNTQFKELYNLHFFLSDIGLFKVFYYHGIVGSLLFGMIHWRLYRVSKESDTALHFTGRSIVYFQVLSPNSIFLYSPEYMFLFFAVYILVKNHNKNSLRYQNKKG